MILMKSKNPKLAATSIRVVKATGRGLVGYVGTVADLRREGLLMECDAPGEAWCYLPKDNPETGAVFADDKYTATEGGIAEC